MTTTILHASCVAVGQRAVLILGPSGSGKSAFALMLMAMGAVLVADDRTDILLHNGVLVARCPAALRGMIEARGLGILNAPCLAEAVVTLVVDLATEETDRLPPRRSVQFFGVACDLVHRSHHDHFPAAVLCYLQHGRRA